MQITARLRVATVDAQPLFREGVISAFRRAKVLEVVGHGGSAEDAVRIATEELPDIVLLDVSIPGGGIEAARAIARVCPVVKIIMLTVSESEDDVKQALEAGARGYVLKGTTGAELLNAVFAVARGESYIAPMLAARLLTHVQRAPARAAGLPELTKREAQILAQVARGLTNKEAARALALCEKTVKHYMTNIMQKLQVRNRVEAVLAFQGGGTLLPQRSVTDTDAAY